MSRSILLRFLPSLSAPGAVQAWESRLRPGLLALLAVGLFQWLALLYAPGFAAPFIYDDLPNIVRNEDFRAEDALRRILGSHSASTHYDKRPVSGLITYANYQINGLNPAGFRAVNLLIHWAAALAAGGVVWAMARALRRRETSAEFRKGALPPEAGGPGRPATVLDFPKLLAVLFCLLWAPHPVHATAVNYINQRQETLMTLFFLLSCLALLLAGERPRREEGRWRLLCAVSALAGLFSKENAAGLPLVLAGIDRLFVSGGWRALWREHRVFWLGLGGLWLGALLWIATGSRLEEWDALPVLGSPWEYFKTECRVVFHYFRLLVWPHPLIFAPVPKIAERWQDWLPYGLGLAVFFGAWARAALRPGRAWLWLPWLAILLVLGPTSSFIPVPLEPDFDYRMHLPSVAALALALACAGNALLRFGGMRRGALAEAFSGAGGGPGRYKGPKGHKGHKGHKGQAAGEGCSPDFETRGPGDGGPACVPPDWRRRALLGAGGLFGALVVVLSLTTRSRSGDFALPESIWLDTVRREPANIKAWLNLAHILHHQGRPDATLQAVAAIQMVNDQLHLPWVEAECHKLRAMTAEAGKNPEPAGEEYRKALALMPGRSDFAAGLAQSLLQRKKPEEALAVLDALPTETLERDPVARLRRATALLALGKREEALRAAAPVEAEALVSLSPELAAALEEWRARLASEPAAAP